MMGPLSDLFSRVSSSHGHSSKDLSEKDPSEMSLDLSVKRNPENESDTEQSPSRPDAFTLNNAFKINLPTLQQLHKSQSRDPEVSESCPPKTDNLSFGVERLLGRSNETKRETPSSTETVYPAISTTPSMTPTLLPTFRSAALFPLSGAHQSSSSIPAFRALHSTLFAANPYVQGLYSQSGFFGLRHDIFHPPGGFHSQLPLGAVLGTGKRKKSWTRAVFSHLQRKGLEKRFQVQKYITKPDRRQLAASLGLTDAQVKVWFQNRRMKWRQQEMKHRREQERAAASVGSSSRPEPLNSVLQGTSQQEFQFASTRSFNTSSPHSSTPLGSDFEDSNSEDEPTEDIKVD